MAKREIPAPKSIKVNFIMNAVLKMSAFIFPLITFPYVSRILGATGNGKITFAASVISYFSMFAQLGIPTYGIRACASCRNDKQRLNQTVFELLLINAVTVGFSYLILAFCLISVKRFQEDIALMCISSCTILLNAIGMDWLFQALEQYSYITIRNIGFKILSVVLMFLFVHKPEHYTVYGTINVIGTCGSNILNCVYARSFLDKSIVKKLDWRKHIKPILSFFMLSVSVSIYTHMDSVMLGFMTTDAEVGYYTAATKMKTILVSAVTALGGVLLPRMSHLVAEGKMRQFYATIRKSLNFIFVVAIPITIYFSIMAGSTIGFLAGNGYAPATTPMKIISLTVVFIGISNITGMQVLVPTNRERITTYSTVAGALINLITNAIAIPKYGAVGAAIGTVVAELTVLVFQLCFMRNEIKDMINGIQFWKIFVANAISTLALYLINQAVVISSNFLALLITAFLFFAIYGVVLVILREDFIIQMLSSFIRQIKDRPIHRRRH